MSNLAPVISLAVDGMHSLLDEIRRIGAFLGGLSYGITASDILKTGSLPGMETLFYKLFINVLSGRPARAVDDFDETVAARETGTILRRQDNRINLHTPGEGGSPAPAPTFSTRVDSDNLTKVGNFLGASGRDTIVSIAHKQLDVLKQIERNTSSGSLSASLDPNTP